ncbi:hypothetical protein K2173_024324 [Erythroxylum novogranatense]|uniref:Transcription repressor n=1 Tax=Erythroxylum novogranatense TaxID=1862640 RepID=A0AAV8SUR9_9ROSI|nr:hypothetical protein K2173_024324 [Erythroxylum novogranatense]
MPRRLRKSLQNYLFKIRNPNPTLQFPSNYNSSPKKKWILLSCKHAKTSSFALDHNQTQQVGDTKDETATLADIDRFLFENFQSLYITNDSDDDDDDSDDDDGDTVRQHPKEKDKEVDEHQQVGSSRRFNVLRRRETLQPLQSFAETGSSSLTTTISEETGSNSTLDNTVNVSTACSNNVDVTVFPCDCIALLQYSPEPHDDFRRSMEDMVGARMQQGGKKLDWDFMQQLLFCYVNLNEKKSHKFILSAFVDLVVSLRQHSDKVPARNKNSKVARDQRRKKLRRNITLKF